MFLTKETVWIELVRRVKGPLPITKTGYQLVAFSSHLEWYEQAISRSWWIQSANITQLIVPRSPNKLKSWCAAGGCIEKSWWRNVSNCNCLKKKAYQLVSRSSSDKQKSYSRTLRVTIRFCHRNNHQWYVIWYDRPFSAGAIAYNQLMISLTDQRTVFEPWSNNDSFLCFRKGWSSATQF